MHDDVKIRVRKVFFLFYHITPMWMIIALFTDVRNKFGEDSIDVCYFLHFKELWWDMKHHLSDKELFVASPLQRTYIHIEHIFHYFTRLRSDWNHLPITLQKVSCISWVTTNGQSVIVDKANFLRDTRCSFLMKGLFAL